MLSCLLKPADAVKIAYKTNGAKNRLQDTAKNRPQDDSENRPDIINPVTLCGVVDGKGLKALLIVKKQTPWCSQVRILGLLLLIDYICRNLKKGTISISADLAHQYVSKLRKKDCPTTISEPLFVLCEVGILEKLRPAVFAHIKTSAVYCFADSYRKKRLRLKVFLTLKLAQKRTFATERNENRLNRKFLWREKLFADLNAITFSDSARSIIANGLAGDGSDNLTRLVRAVDLHEHRVTVSVRGQITTTIGSCPRDLLPHLLFHGEPVVSCDISHAHWNFLSLVLANRLDFVSDSPGRHDYINDGWREHNQLVALLSDGDFYRIWCADPTNDDERDGKKNILNILLNTKNEECERNALYRRIRTEFPITFGVLTDIKRKDNRILSKLLHRYMADAVEAALLEVQREGIAAIPLVDALICQQKNRERVCQALGKQIFAVTGVRCKVGTVRYSP